MKRNSTKCRSSWFGRLSPPASIILPVLAATLGSLAARGAEKLVLADKTLVAWVARANLSQRGGSALTLEKSGGTFDAIVLGEIAPSRWMAGSNGFSRTQKVQDSLLETVRELKPRRILLVFGAGGDRDKSKRPRMGEVAAALADVTFLTSDNPRSEDPLAIITDIEKGLVQGKAKDYRLVPDRREAIARALAEAGRGDCVLVVGKGHENYQTFKDRTVPFDDGEVIRSVLSTMEAKP